MSHLRVRGGGGHGQQGDPVRQRDEGECRVHVRDEQRCSPGTRSTSVESTGVFPTTIRRYVSVMVSFVGMGYYEQV